MTPSSLFVDVGAHGSTVDSTSFSARGDAHAWTIDDTEAVRRLADVALPTGQIPGGGVTAMTLVLVLALGMARLNFLVVSPGGGQRLARLLGRPLPLSLVSGRRFVTTVTVEAVVLLAAVAVAAVLTTGSTAHAVDPAHDQTAVRTDTV